MRGRLRKPGERAQGHREHVVVTTAPGVLAIRPAPKGLLREIVAQWESFWRSPIAGAVDWDRDGARLERLFWLRDEIARLNKTIRKQRLVPGSTGQPVLNPLAGHMKSLLGELRHLEDSFGMSPRSAGQLGVTLADMQKTLDDLNRDANDGDADTDDDPRLLAAR